MIIFKSNKYYEENKRFPNGNFTHYDDNDLYIIDETTEEGTSLAKKIIENAPYYDFVLENGKLVDITPTERPVPEPTVPIPTTEEMLLEAYLKINELENRLQILEGGN